METAVHAVLYVLAAALFGVGVVGCVVPMLPGPPAAWAGMLCLLWTPLSPGIGWTVATGVLAAAVTVWDSVVSGWGARRFKGSKWGAWGGVLGAVAGVFFLPWGLLAGPFLGAAAGELLAGRRLGRAAWSGVGATAGFLCGTFAKLAACAFMAGVILAAARGGSG